MLPSPKLPVPLCPSSTQPSHAGSPPSVGDFPVPSLEAGLFPPLPGRHMETSRIKLQIRSF